MGNCFPCGLRRGRMTSKLKGSRLEAEVDRCRSECNWKRLGEILPSIRAKNSGIEHLGDLLEAEYIFETFIEKHSEFLEPKKEYAEELQKCETLLKNVIETSANEKASPLFEANLLLAKLHYYCAEYEQVLKDVERSRLELGDTPFVTLRALRLVAEAYAVKGFSIEATLRRGSQSQQEKSRMRALFCFEKSAELTISYVQELEKLLTSSSRSSSGSILSSQQSNGTNGRHPDKMGDLLESTLERVPLLRLRRNLCDRPCDVEGVEWYRRIMTSLGDKFVCEKLQQRLSRQLAEVLIRGMPESDYMSSQSVSSKSQSLGFYTGSHKNYFSPSSRMEEVLLLLLISEVLATKDVVLSRAEELASSRAQSIQAAKSVYNLLTLVLSTLRQYELLASIYERAMKFANEDRYIWFVELDATCKDFRFQFALTLLCHGRWVRASRILSQCIAMDKLEENAAVKHMLAAQIEIEHLGQYDEAISHAEKAIELSEGSWLSGRCHLLHAIAFSLKAEGVVRYVKRKEMSMQAIDLFEKATQLDPHDDVAHYYCARQYAIVRDIQAAREWCERTLELNPEMPSALMLMALIFTAQKDYKGALELVVEALNDFPSNFPLLVLKLKLDVKFGRVEEALSTSKHLLQFWRRADTSYFGDTAAPHITNLVSEVSQREVRGSVARSMSSREAMTPIAPMLAAPLGIVPPSPMTSSVAGTSNLDLTEANSMFTGGMTSTSEIGATASSISEGLGSSSAATRNMLARFHVQANVWLELAELYLDLDRVAEVRPCVEEACSIFPNSHPALYLKGRLLALRAERCTDATTRERMRMDAKASLLGALAISPSHIASLNHLAEIYRSEGNIPMAEKMLKDVVRIDPLHNESWQMLGMILAEDGRHDEALECFETASSLDSSTPLIPFTAIPLVIRSS
uniref:Tetratricopeptide repeat protein 7 N-terminal domain-containing protein n=1 Tax=Ascaris lumbricoides TaxID=6252 RepID=A0A9J2NR25_ASCLU